MGEMTTPGTMKVSIRLVSAARQSLEQAALEEIARGPKPDGHVLLLGTTVNSVRRTFTKRERRCQTGSRSTSRRASSSGYEIIGE